MLHLHIGTGKTGSTTIQDFLLQHRDQVPLEFVESFSIGSSWKLAVASNTPESREYWTTVAKRISQNEYDSFIAEVWEATRAEVESSSAVDFVVSCEFLYNHLAGEPQALRQLHERLRSIFGDVHVMVYLRDQLDFLKSVYAQQIKGSKRYVRSFDRYVADLPEMRSEWDHAHNIRMLLNELGPDRVTVVPFDRRNFYGENLVCDFLNRVGIHDSDLLRAAGKFQNSNVSPTFGQLNILRRINHIPIPVPQVQSIMSLIAVNKMTEKIGPRDFPNSYDAQIIEMVSEGNSWLNDNILKNYPSKLTTS